MCGARRWLGGGGGQSKVPVGTSSFSVWENWIFFFLLSGFVSIFPTFIVRSAVQAQIALRPHEWLPIDPGAVRCNGRVADAALLNLNNERH